MLRFKSKKVGLIYFQPIQCSDLMVLYARTNSDSPVIPRTLNPCYAANTGQILHGLRIEHGIVFLGVPAVLSE